MKIKPKINTVNLPADKVEEQIRLIWEDFGRYVWGHNMSKKSRNLIGKPSIAGSLTPSGRVRKFAKTRAQGRPPRSRVSDSVFGLRYKNQPHYTSQKNYTVASHFLGNEKGSQVTQLLEWGGTTKSWWIWKPERRRYRKRKGVLKRRKPDIITFDENVARYYNNHIKDAFVKSRVQKTYHPSLSLAADYVMPRASKEFAEMLKSRFRPGGMTKIIQGSKSYSRNKKK